MKTEIFKTISLTKNQTHYNIDVNHDGTIIYVNGKLAKQYLVKKSSKKPGGSFWTTYIDGKNFRKLTHHLVALAWIENPNNYSKILHIDTNTENNHYKNLVWGEQRHVAMNMKVMGRHYMGVTKTGAIKNTRNNSKLSENDVSKIILRIKVGKEYLKDIAKDYSVSEMSIQRIKKRYLTH